MYQQFGQKTIIPQVLVNLIWSFDDRNRILYTKCIEQLKRAFFKNRLIERLRFEFNIFNNLSSHRYFRTINPERYENIYFEPNFGFYMLYKLKIFKGDQVPNENLPHFKFNNGKLK